MNFHAAPEEGLDNVPSHHFQVKMRLDILPMQLARARKLGAYEDLTKHAMIETRP